MAKRVVILTVGTRGDIQPFLALALALKKFGYSVRLAAPENFKEWVESFGIEFAKCGGDFQAFLTDPKIIKILNSNIFTQLKESQKIGRELHMETAQDTVNVTQDADALIFNLLVESCTDIAEAKKIPALLAALQPLTPTGDFPLPSAIPSLGRFFNRLSYSLLHLNRAIHSKMLSTIRTEQLNLPPRPRFTRAFTVAGQPAPVIYGFSSSVIARPKDWPDEAQITGYWFLDSEKDWTPPQSLASFLEKGDPPIYVGFGSMPTPDAKAKAQMITQAIEKAGKRAVVAKGWGNFDPTKSGELPESVYVLDSVPHEHLFPLVHGVVHHGGAGTTAAGLRAGQPTLICPFLSDQPFWAKRIEALGVGPRPLPPHRWTVERLAHTFCRLTETPGYARRAQQISQVINSEDGLSLAVEIIAREIGAP